MAQKSYYSDLDLVPRGYQINPDWNRNFREDQDRMSKMFDEILDMTIREHTKYKRTMLEDVYFTKYYGWGNYCLVFKMREDYDNIEHLFGVILESIDESLRWYDITELINFNIYIITPYRTFRITYLDLLYEYVTMVNRIIHNPITFTHPRLQKMKEWVSKYREYERYTTKSCLAGDPYSYMDRGREQREFLGLRNDNRRLPPQEFRGIRRGDYNTMIGGGEDFYHQQMSVQIERIEKVNKESILTKLKNKIRW